RPRPARAEAVSGSRGGALAGVAGAGVAEGGPEGGQREAVGGGGRAAPVRAVPGLRPPFRGAGALGVPDQRRALVLAKADQRSVGLATPGGEGLSRLPTMIEGRQAHASQQKSCTLPARRVHYNGGRPVLWELRHGQLSQDGRPPPSLPVDDAARGAAA